MKPLSLTACDFMIYKDYKKQPLKFFFPIRGINIRIQHHTGSLINHRVAIHHNISLKSPPIQVSLSHLPSTFDHTLFDQ